MPVPPAHAAPFFSRQFLPNSPPGGVAQTFDELQPELEQPTWIRDLMRGDDFHMRVGSRQGAATPPVLLDEEIRTQFALHYDASISDLLKDIRTPLRYTDFSAEVAPRLLVNCPGWPLGRKLNIHNIRQGSLMLDAGLQVDDKPPVRVVRSPAAEHYLALQDGKLMRTPAAGDCFYIAVLASMEPQERRELLAAAGCTGTDAEHFASAVLALRHHLANHLSEHRQDYRDLIVQLQALIA